MKRFIGNIILAAIFVQYNSFTILAQDIVTSEEITFGSSVFILRSANKTQKKFAPQVTKVSKQNSTKRIRESVVYAKTPRKSESGLQNKRGNMNAQGQKASKEKASQDIAMAAQTFLEKGDFTTAIDYFLQATTLDPNNEDAKRGLSRAYTVKANHLLESKRYEEAISFYNQAISYDNQNAAAFAGLGESFEALGRKEEALSNYEKALSIDPKLEDLYVPIAGLYLEKGEVAKADQFISKVSTKNSADTQYLRGLIYYKMDSYPDALAAFNETIKLDPNKAEAYYYQAETLDRLNQNDQALEAYRKAVQLKPDFLEAWFDLGVALYNRGDYQMAVDAYKKAIQLKPDYAEAYLNLANTFRKLKKYEEANSNYVLASNFIKNNADLYSEWGFCLAAVGKWNSAIEKLNLAVSMSPDAIDYANLGWAYYNSAQEDLRNRQNEPAKSKLAKAKEALQKAVQLNPRLAPAFLNLGITLTDLGEYEQAIKALSTAVSLRKSWVFALNELGIAYRKFGKLDPAAENFREALKVNPDFVPALYNLGEVEMKRGNKKEALKAYERLKRLNPDLAKQLDIIISGAVLQNKLNEPAPLPKKIPRIPF